MDMTRVNVLANRVVVCGCILRYFRIIAQIESHRRIGNAYGIVIEPSSGNIALPSSWLSDAPAEY
jgi:hypothetical protein